MNCTVPRVAPAEEEAGTSRQLTLASFAKPGAYSKNGASSYRTCLMRHLDGDAAGLIVLTESRRFRGHRLRIAGLAGMLFLGALGGGLGEHMTLPVPLGLCPRLRE
jgi:hypothetical protein